MFIEAGNAYQAGGQVGALVALLIRLNFSLEVSEVSLQHTTAGLTHLSHVRIRDTLHGPIDSPCKVAL